MHHEAHIPHTEPPVDPPTFIAPRRGEVIFGIIYLVLHMLFIGPAIYLGFLALGTSLSAIALNLIYFLTATLVSVLIMRRYLIASFARFRTYGFLQNLKVFGLGLAIRYGSAIPLSTLILILLPDFSATPNTEAVHELANQHFFFTAFLAVVLAPIVEELLFRGAIYGGLRNKSKVAAYLVSTLLFALLHVLSFLFFIPLGTLFLMMLLYIPSGFALAWSYEKSGNIWTPIFLHALMNVIALALGGILPEGGYY